MKKRVLVVCALLVGSLYTADKLPEKLSAMMAQLRTAESRRQDYVIDAQVEVKTGTGSSCLALPRACCLSLLSLAMHCFPSHKNTPPVHDTVLIFKRPGWLDIYVVHDGKVVRQ